MDKELQKLVGYTVSQIALDYDGDEDSLDKFYGLVLVKKGDPQKLIAWIQQDPEGNGPGFLQIEKH